MIDESEYAFRSVPEDHFPLKIEMIAKLSGEVVHVIDVPSPGFVEIPGLRSQYGPIAVRITYGTGRVDYAA